MISKATVILSMIGGLAGFIAYRAYEVSELTSALLVLFIVGWIFNAMIGLGGLWSLVESLWNFIGLFKHPFMASLLIGGLGFTYWTFQGNLFGQSSVFMTGMMFLGAAFGMWTFMYWNIGG